MGLKSGMRRQMKALTGLSQAQFDYLLPVFSDIYRVTQQHTYEEGFQSGTRRRRPAQVTRKLQPWWRNYSLSSTIIKRIYL